MPFSAEINVDGDWVLVNIDGLNNPKDGLSDVDIRCHYCASPMHVRHTWRVRAHFAHNPNFGDGCLFNEGEYRNESDAHRMLKQEIKKWILSRPEYRGCEVVLEYAMRDIGRIADVAVFYNGVLVEAHEAQISPITAEEMDARTQDYNRRGAEVTWWLGLRANRADLREHCRRRYRYCCTAFFGFESAADRGAKYEVDESLMSRFGTVADPF